jgi:predicted CXXCH cytochrome family protein
MFDYEPVVMTPLSIPGAEYVGAENCAAEDCHPKEYKYFQSVAIDITEEDAEAGQVEACEACHGPGSLHVEDPYDKSKIIRANAETACFTCHLDVKGKFMLQHHHPVPEGRMFCYDCHDMHGSDVRATGGKMLLGAGLLGRDEKCFKCHKEMKGPFVFEHEAMREGCSVCHTPHGSINDKLLVAGQTITCVRCHIEGSGGEFHHTTYPIALRRDCIDCHTKIHGSNTAKSSFRY